MMRITTSTSLLRFSFMMMIAATFLTINAQTSDVYFIDLDFDADKAALYLQNHIDKNVASRNQPRQVLKNTRLWSEEMFWTDGSDVYSTYYDEDLRQLIVMHENAYPDNEKRQQIVALPVKSNKICPDDLPGGSFSLERIGGCTMLVARNAEGTPVRSYYAISQDDYYHGKWTVFMHYLLMGNYLNPQAPEECNNVFGLNMPHYENAKYSHDPGIFAYHAEPDDHYIIISYGGGRVSRGRPGSEKSTMEGAGGRGAIMGAMQWQVFPTVEGVTAIVTNDQPYVSHMPGIGEQGDTVRLPKLQTPFKEIPGKWAFASVIPLTHSILRICPKQMLTLMRGEIYARHGDTFKDPETQSYFDAQPWYKKSGKPVRLTDLERFNYQLIKQVESAME